MQIICNNETITVNEIIASSKTLQNMIADVGDINDQYPIIPSRYYTQIHMKIESFDTIQFKLNLYIFLKANQEFFVNNPEEKSFMTCTKMQDLKIELLGNINNRILMLEFYDFLEVDEKNINELAKEIGILLEQSENDVEIIPELFSIIIEQYPSLAYHPRYTKICRESYKRIFHRINDNKHKYASIYYVQHFFTVEDMQCFCLAGNYEYVKYLFDNGISSSNIQDNIHNYFASACNSQNLELIQFIFRKGAIINNSILSKACAYCDIAIFKFLFDNFNGEIHFEKLLEEICSKNNLEFLKYLIGKGRC
jgi:hypothetical protein